MFSGQNKFCSSAQQDDFDLKKLMCYAVTEWVEATSVRQYTPWQM